MLGLIYRILLKRRSLLDKARLNVYGGDLRLEDSECSSQSETKLRTIIHSVLD
jgi:hypothetical protein